MKKNIDINKLMVNPKNPRFDPVRDEKAALNTMVREAGKELLNLAEDIIQHGFNPSKRLMVTPLENGKFLALEGNRRVIAAKLLNNPEMADSKKYINQFLILQKKYSSQIPNKVDCVIFPDKESAFHWLNLEHTGSNRGRGVLRWNTEQRKRFLSQYIGKKPARSIQVLDFADQNGIDRDGVDSTTLDDRILSNAFVREQMGIDFPKGFLDLIRTKSEVVKNLKRVFREMSKSSFKVAEVYTKTKAEEWVKKVLGKQTSKKSEGKDAKDKESEGKTGDQLANPISFPLPVKRLYRYSVDEAIRIVEYISANFSNAASALSDRYDGRETIMISDEYDVQDFMRILLRLFFDQIYREEWTPSYMGKATRVDFLLKHQKIVLEIKKTGEKLKDDELRKQLIEDTHHYNQSQDCKTLIIFIYDPSKILKDPTRIKADLERQTFASLKVICLIES